MSLPLRTVSESNVRCHPLARHRRTKAARSAVVLALGRRAKRLGLPVVVTLTRISAGELDDDNLRGALKAVRDGVADALGVDDRDARVRWAYGQRRCKRGEYGVEVRVERVPDPEGANAQG